MEQETKNKSKRAIAIAGIATLSAFALIGLFAIGALIGGCAEKKQADAPASEQVQTARHLGRAGMDVTPDYGVDLIPSLERLDGGTIYYSSGDWVTERYPNGALLRLSSPNQRYYVTCDWEDGSKDLTLFFATSNVLWYTASSAIEHGDRNVIPSSSIYSVTGPFDSVAHEYVFSPHPSVTEVIFRVGYSTLEHLHLYLLQDAPTKETYTLPDNWNPYQLLGATPSEAHDGTFTGGVGSVSFNPLFFRSGGLLWNSINIETANMENNLVGWYDAQGRLQYKRVTTSGARVISQVTYSLTGQSAQQSVVAMRYERVLVDNNGTDEYVYLTLNGRYWSNPNYRKVEVVYQTADTWQPSGLYAPRKPSEWLTSTYADKTAFDPQSWGDPDGNANVFTIIGEAFASMTPIFGIEVFPSLTLGVLVILPLIAGVIVLIIKAVSK